MRENSNNGHALSLVPTTGKRVAELRIQGNSPEAISEILKLKPKDVTARLSEMFGPLGASPMEVNRRIRLAQLDKILNALWARCEKGELYAIDRALKTIEAAARLEGCYNHTAKNTNEDPRATLAGMLGCAAEELESKISSAQVTVRESTITLTSQRKNEPESKSEINITPNEEIPDGA